MHPDELHFPQIIQIQLVSPECTIPVKATAGAAAYDVFSRDAMKINGTVCIPLGFRLQMPRGMYAQLHGRSGHALRLGFITHDGIIDQDYRGEVCLIVHAPSDYEVQKGERIGQITFHRYVSVDLVSVRHLDETERGSGGFGSTGTTALSGDLRSSTDTATLLTELRHSSSSCSTASAFSRAVRSCDDTVSSPLSERTSAIVAEQSGAPGPFNTVLSPFVTDPVRFDSSGDISKGRGGIWR